MFIYGRGGRQGIHSPIFSREEVERVLAEGGKLTIFQLLRCRVRYFTQGFALGSAPFVEDQFRANPDHFGKTRKTGARKIRAYAGEMGELYVARDLRKDIFRPMEA